MIWVLIYMFLQGLNKISAIKAFISGKVIIACKANKAIKVIKATKAIEDFKDI